MTDRSQVLFHFREFASEIAEKDFSHVTTQSVIAELGVDSLAMLEVVGELERAYKVQIPDEDLANVRLVGDLVDVIFRLATA